MIIPIYFTCVYLLQVFYDECSMAYLILSAIFACLHRIVWSLMLACIIYQCHTSKGFICQILSMNFWKPFAKLGITLLVIHPLYQTSTIFNLRVEQNYDPWWFFHCGVGDIFVCSLIAMIFYSTIEMPIVLLEKSFSKLKEIAEQIPDEVDA